MKPDRISIIALAALCGVGVLFHSSESRALVIDSDLYCSAGANAAVNSDTSSSNLATSDVTLTIGASSFDSSDCYGAFSQANNATATHTADINDIYQGAGSAFVYLDRDDEASGAGLGGITFTITTGDLTQTSGSFTVTWTDNAGGSDLPVTTDLVVLIKGGPDAAAYLLDDLLLPVSPTSGTGTFDIQFTNPGGNEPGLSHIFLAGRLQSTTTEVPEPAAMITFGIGLLALGGVAARMQRRCC